MTRTDPHTARARKSVRAAARAGEAAPRQNARKVDITDKKRELANVAALFRLLGFCMLLLLSAMRRDARNGPTKKTFFAIGI
jgi:hypothetical protein